MIDPYTLGGRSRIILELANILLVQVFSKVFMPLIVKSVFLMMERNNYIISIYDKHLWQGRRKHLKMGIGI